MSLNRSRRVAGEMKKVVGRLISQEIKDPRIASLTSVTGVELTRDLRYATIHVSIYGDEAEKKQTMQTLQRASGFIRSEIGKSIRLRYTPEITFAEDRSMEYGEHIDRVLKSLDEDNRGE
ncbi:MAG: 30S ribosome-binding factor RbfA [Firmicutes bacterium]|nr:30S ribosome-binding factor RbfA [Bacillota bacterium]